MTKTIKNEYIRKHVTLLKQNASVLKMFIRETVSTVNFEKGFCYIK